MRFLLFIILFSFQLMAAPRVVILTSLKEEKLIKKMEHYALKKLKNFHIEWIHHASQVELYKALLSAPEALIWVSHGSNFGNETALGVTPQILDERGQDLSPVFQVLKTQTQYLGVVSCYSQKSLIFQQVPADYLKNYFVTEKKIEAYFGFKRALKRLLKTEFEKRNQPSKNETGDQVIKVLIGAKNDQVVRVFNKNKFLGLVQTEKDFFLEGKLQGTIRLEIEKGEIWGEAEVFYNQQKLKVFSDKNGVPVGITSRVFLK
jgi:hypothetical protein